MPQVPSAGDSMTKRIWAVFKEHAVSGLKQWMRENNIHVLNIAGPGASKAPTVAEFVITTLDAAFKP